jgi:DNA-binding IclR family transcriptional regulator
MSNSNQTTEQPASEQAVLKALASSPDATVADVAAAANVGRSTASKVLARLASSGEVRRTEGGRDGARRLPDHFALASAEPAVDEAKPKAAAATEPKADAEPKAAGEHLKPGQLDELVLGFLKENTDSGPHGPTTVAKALGRSGGAVGNCLVRLTKAEQVRQDNDKPRRYSLAA